MPLQGRFRHTKMQAELAAATGVKAEESADEESDKDDGSSSESSVFGLDKSSAPPPAQKKAATVATPGSRRRSQSHRSESPENADPDPADGLDKPKPERPAPKSRLQKEMGQQSRRKSGEGQNQNPIATAHSTLQLLQQISPASLWQGKIKEQDLQSRLKKGGAAIGDVQRFQGTLPEDSPQKADCERLLSGLGDLIEAGPLCRDVFCKLKAKQQVMQSLQDALFQADLMKVFALDTLDMETASAILSAIAQKVVEAKGAGGEKGSLLFYPSDHSRCS